MSYYPVSYKLHLNRRNKFTCRTKSVENLVTSTVHFYPLTSNVPKPTVSVCDKEKTMNLADIKIIFFIWKHIILAVAHLVIKIFWNSNRTLTIRNILFYFIRLLKRKFELFSSMQITKQRANLIFTEAKLSYWTNPFHQNTNANNVTNRRWFITKTRIKIKWN